VLLFKKEGETLRLYVGSGTDSCGVRTQFYNYEINNRVPKLVMKAIKDGFTLAHRGPLC
jgi:hypothetical protein